MPTIFSFKNRSFELPNGDKHKAQGQRAAASATLGKTAKSRFRPCKGSNTKPSLPLSAYVGKYSNPFFGSIEIVEANGKLKFILNKDVTGELSHWQFDTFMSAWSKKWYPDGVITFTISSYSATVESINADGAVLRKEPKPAR